MEKNRKNLSLQVYISHSNKYQKVIREKAIVVPQERKKEGAAPVTPNEPSTNRPGRY